MSETQKNTVRIRLRPAAEKAVRAGHPWVFADSIKSEHRTGDIGDLAIVYDRNDRFLAAGLYDPESPISVRIVHAGKPTTIDQEFWQARLDAAFAKRAQLFESDTDGYRVINGENDGYPGLVLDRYADVLVLKVYTSTWLPRVGMLLELLEERDGRSGVVLRLARNIQSLAASQFKLRDGSVLNGVDVPERVVFQENGIRFHADVIKGQKTGFFLDQRDNRAKVGSLASGRTVLNCFSFSGGFSLHAALNGAKAVADLDISQHALDSATANFELNAANPSIAACPHETIKANAFDWLKEVDGRRFDLIVIDPPSLAKRESERTNALSAYRQLTAAGIRRLERNGILVSASCSAHVRAEEFFDLVLDAARNSGRQFRELERTDHAADHPATFREAEYLKCVYLEFDGDR